MFILKLRRLAILKPRHALPGNKVFNYQNTRYDDGNAQNRNRSTSQPRVKPKQCSKSQSRIDFNKLAIKNLCITVGEIITL